jgi:hypothetical protein
VRGRGSSDDAAGSLPTDRIYHERCELTQGGVRYNASHYIKHSDDFPGDFSAHGYGGRI